MWKQDSRQLPFTAIKPAPIVRNSSPLVRRESHVVAERDVTLAFRDLQHSLIRLEPEKFAKAVHGLSGGERELFITNLMNPQAHRRCQLVNPPIATVPDQEVSERVPFEKRPPGFQAMSLHHIPDSVLSLSYVRVPA